MRVKTLQAWLAVANPESIVHIVFDDLEQDSRRFFSLKEISLDHDCPTGGDVEMYVLEEDVL